MAKRKNPWDIPATTLAQPEAQQRMYALAAEQDRLQALIDGLDAQLCGVLDEKVSLLKRWSGLRFRPPKETR